MSRLTASEVFPAGLNGLSARMLALATGVRVRVVEAGPANGVPVVMLHGWAASLYTFRHALRLLPPRGIRAIAVDLRGHGLSDHPRGRAAYSLDVMLADLDALFDALEVDRPVVLGHSMGGGIALHHALRRPGRASRLVLINPVGLVRIGWVRIAGLVPRVLMDVLGARAVPRWLAELVLRRIAFSDGGRLTARDVDEYWALARQPGFARAIRAQISEFDWSPLDPAAAGSLPISSLIILGTRDRVVRRARPAAERVSGGQVVTVEGGHCVHEESPDAVYRVVVEFLRALG